MAYTIDSIKKLDFFEAVRKYPGMYIGSKDADGLHHLAKEIISNSIDEYLNGNCSKIDVILKADGSLLIKDNGRGIPIGKKGDGKTALELCFTTEHAGGKFLNSTGESGYNSAGGMHGLGTKCVNALSDKMFVRTSVGGKTEFIEFNDGIIVNHKTENIDKDIHGVEVQFYPSLKYLETIDFSSTRLKKLIQEFSFLCKGLTFTFEDEKENAIETFISNNGLYDYLEYLNGDKKQLCQPFYFEKSDGTFKVEVAFGYNNSYSSNIKLYTNNIPQEKGTHLTGFKTAFTSCLNAFARDKKWLKEKDDNLQGSDYDEGLMLIINFKMIDPVFKGQNKEELSSSEGRTYVQKLSILALRELFQTNEKDIKIIFDKAITAKKASEAAKKARDAARNIVPKEKGLKAKMELSSKFIDCTSKKSSERNLHLVEGLSAGSAAVEARNAKIDCIYMLRGKVVSPLKTSIDKLLANQEISDIVKVIGGGFGDKFDVDKMNFDKIVITTDQDSDGLDIELLLITFFYTYMRPLVEAGKLYRAVTPLYIVRTKTEELYFYSDDELEEWKRKGIKGFDLLRAKGLGELNAADLHKVCFENERYKRITISDAKKTTNLLEVLQGAQVEPRKKYIYENANNLGFNFD